MQVAFEAPCPQGRRDAAWSASCPVSVGDPPIVTYDIRCPRCTNVERFRDKWRFGKRV
jgi:hypothetical protein